MPRGEHRSWMMRLALPLSGVALVGAFVLDRAFEARAAAPILYLLPVLLGLVSPWPRHVIVAGGLGAALTIVSWVVGGSGVAVGGIDAHRVFDLASLGLGTAVVELARRSGVRLGIERDALRRSQRSLEEVRWAMDQSLMVAVLDADELVSHVNDLYCQVLGYAREECVGRPIGDFGAALNRPELLAQARATVRAGKVWRGETRARTKAGEVLWLDTTVVPLFDEAERVRGFLTLRVDITARKADEALAQERATLLRLGEMAAAVAHEVQNPVTGLDGALKIVAGRLPVEAPERGLIAHMRERLQVLAEVIEDVLLFARPQPLVMRPTSVLEVLRRAVAIAIRDPVAGRASIDLEVGDAPLDADVELLARAFAGLVKNAAQAASPGGVVAVSGGRVGDAIVVAVTDDGPGVAPEVLARAFQPFFTTRAQGTGLGLPLARRTIEAHGGTVGLERPASGGTVARVTLALAARPEAR